MENTEEIFHFLEEFSKRKPKTIPQELNDYLAYVARTGDPVYQWSLVKCLFKEKLLNVITDFYETTPGIEIPPYPNVDPFNYDIMKNSLLERLDSFTSAPFTVQRICELLTCPRKQYNRIDKFMRAVEKNILVVSTREPGPQRHLETENGESIEPAVNGSDNNSEYNVDVEMEDMSWKENNDTQHNSEPQPSSSDAHISVDDIETHVPKQESPNDTPEKAATQSESQATIESNMEITPKEKEDTETSETIMEPTTVPTDTKTVEDTQPSTDVDTDMRVEESKPALTIPDIKVDDAEMTEQRLIEENKENENTEEIKKTDNLETNTQPISSDESSSDSNFKEENEVKHISEVSTSSEESSSSDNNESSSNSPKAQVIPNAEEVTECEKKAEPLPENEKEPIKEVEPETPQVPAKIESDNYSISDVNSELAPIKKNEPIQNDSSMESTVEDSDKKEEKEDAAKGEATEA